jgi:hypothetical protein
MVHLQVGVPGLEHRLSSGWFLRWTVGNLGSCDAGTGTDTDTARCLASYMCAFCHVLHGDGCHVLLRGGKKLGNHYDI